MPTLSARSFQCVQAHVQLHLLVHRWYRQSRAAVALALVFVVGSLVANMALAGAPDVAAVGPKQQFVPPAPGSYRLELIQRAPRGTVVGLHGKASALTPFVTGKITLLSFMYTYCVDPIGCPLAYNTLVELRKRLLSTPALARQVRFVSLSFDPTNDTPAAMRAYAGALADPQSALQWQFLTTRSVAELLPMIADAGQDVSVTLDAQGKPTRLFNHLLKIFLIDAQGQVREIYTTAYLLPDVLLNDIKTLAMAPRSR